MKGPLEPFGLRNRIAPLERSCLALVEVTFRDLVQLPPHKIEGILEAFFYTGLADVLVLMDKDVIAGGIFGAGLPSDVRDPNTHILALSLIVTAV